MKSRYTLQYHPAARQDLFDIFELIENYAGPDVAHRKLDQIEFVTKSLVDFPHKGSLRETLGSNIRAIPAGEKAVICFRTNESDHTVLILSISYAGADWTARIKNRN